MKTTTKTPACSCGILAGNTHPVGRSEEFGGETVTWDNGYNAAHGVAEYHRANGYEARVFSERGFGWSVQARPVVEACDEPTATIPVETMRAMVFGGAA